MPKSNDAIAFARKAGNSAAARVLLGNAYYQKRDYATALKYYEAVLAEDRNHTEAQSGAKAARDKLSGTPTTGGGGP